MTRTAVLQSNYIPWKGYFDLIHDVDLFVFYDDVQFTKNDWRNRNRIKTNMGSAWLTIPVGQDENRLIQDVALTDSRWASKHWKSIRQYYSRAPYFSRYQEFFEHVYLGQSWSNLSQLNQFLVRSISSDLLGIRTEFKNSRDYVLTGQKADRLTDLLRQLDTSIYHSGPAAQDYLSEDKLRDQGIRLIYKSYAEYPEYPQFFPPFDHYVSILDLLFHTGEDAPYYIWGWREGKGSDRSAESLATR